MIPVEAHAEYEELVSQRAAKLIDAADAAGATARLLKSIAVAIGVEWDDFERYWLDPAIMPIAVCEALAWRLPDLPTLSGSAPVKARALGVLRARQDFGQVLRERAHAQRQRDWEMLLRVEAPQPVEGATEALAQAELSLLRRMALEPQLHQALVERVEIEVKQRLGRRPLDLIEHARQSRALAAGGWPFSDESVSDEAIDDARSRGDSDEDDRASLHLCGDISEWLNDVDLVVEALGRLLEGAAEWGFAAIAALRDDPTFRADVDAFIEASERADGEIEIEPDVEELVEEVTPQGSDTALAAVLSDVPALVDRWRLSFDPELVAALERRAVVTGQAQRDVKTWALECGMRLAWDHRLDEQMVRLGRVHVKDDSGERRMIVPGRDFSASELVRWIHQEALRAAKHVLLDLPYPPQNDDASRFFRTETDEEARRASSPDASPAPTGASMIEVLNQEFDDTSGDDQFYDAEERQVWTHQHVEAARSVATAAQRRILDAWMQLPTPTWADVARELACSPGAVTTQIQRLKAKLGIRVAKASVPSPARETYRAEVARRKRKGGAG